MVSPALVLLTLAVFLNYFAIVEVEAACSSALACTSCTVQSGCGWCAATVACVAGNSLGPTTGSCTQGWAYNTSQFAYAQPGFPVTPGSLYVYLNPNQKLQINYTVTSPILDNLNLDVMFDQDTTGSMGDMLALLQSLTPVIANGIKSFQYNLRMGLATFIDVPGTGYTGVFRHKVNQVLISNVLQVQQKIQACVATGNYDNPESSFDSMMFLTLCYQTGNNVGNNLDPGWLPTARKIIIMITDDWPKCTPECVAGWNDPYQVYTGLQLNDPRSGGQELRPCIGNTSPLYTNPALTALQQCQQADVTANCNGIPSAQTNYKYTSEAFLVQIMQQNNIVPIVLVALPQLGQGAGSCYGYLPPSNLEEIYCKSGSCASSYIGLPWGGCRTCAVQNGQGGCGNCFCSQNSNGYYTGIGLACSSSCTATVFNNCFGSCVTARTLLQQDLIARYQEFINRAQYGTVLSMLANSPTARTDMVTAIVNAIESLSQLLALQAIQDTYAIVQQGYAIPIGTVPNCISGQCTSTPKPQYNNTLEGQQYLFTATLLATSVVNTTIILRVPGASNSFITTIYVVPYILACNGCDRVLNSNALYDKCGVCKGNNSTCTDCFGQVITGGGFIAVNDVCGVCNGNGLSCLGCDNKIYPPPQYIPKLDNCGICNGTNDCLDCLGVAFGSSHLDACGVCNGNNTCLGCDGVPYSNKTLDVCGVCGGNGLSCRNCQNLTAGMPGYNPACQIDQCGVCCGNSSCVGCDGIPVFPPAIPTKLDQCGKLSPLLTPPHSFGCIF